MFVHGLQNRWWACAPRPCCYFLDRSRLFLSFPFPTFPNLLPLFLLFGRKNPLRRPLFAGTMRKSSSIFFPTSFFFFCFSVSSFASARSLSFLVSAYSSTIILEISPFWETLRLTAQFCSLTFFHLGHHITSFVISPSVLARNISDIPLSSLVGARSEAKVASLGAHRLRGSGCFLISSFADAFDRRRLPSAVFCAFNMARRGFATDQIPFMHRGRLARSYRFGQPEALSNSIMRLWSVSLSARREKPEV